MKDIFTNKAKKEIINYKNNDDFFTRHKIGSRLMFLSVWFIFLILSYRIINGHEVNRHFLNIISDLVLYLTLFIGGGVNVIEKAIDKYNPKGVKK